jgi:hypothetical protein
MFVLYVISFSLHVACFVATLYYQNDHSNLKIDSYLYAYYQPSVAGDDARQNTSFIEELDMAYEKACIVDAPQKNPKQLLMLHAQFDDERVPVRNVTQTWMPTRTSWPWMSEVNGYYLLIVISVASFIFQAVFFCYAIVDRCKFERPLLERWFEYALTSPLQIVLIGSSLMLRDVHTIALLFVAQLVCVVLGFAVEYSIYDAGAQNAEHEQPEFKELKFVVDCVDFNRDAHAEQEDHNKKTNIYAKLYDVHPEHTQPTIREQAMQLFFVCFFASGLLHTVIWGILIMQFMSFTQDTDCYQETGSEDLKADTSDDWVGPLRIVVLCQFALFTSFALVPVIQIISIVRYHADRKRVFQAGSTAYAALSVSAKFILCVSYISFVRLFPFETK